MTLSNKKEGQVIKTMALLDVKNVKKIYTTRFGGNQVEALHNVSFSVEAGEYVAIMGESGSGKTTLLNILAALDKPTGGKVYLKGNDLGKIREKEMAAFRRQNLGFVFQDFNLLDTLTLKDNIFLPLVLSGKKYTEMESRIAPIAEQLGISKLLNKYPYEVSGGQKQRAAAARALITQPQLILADEPTGALDSRSTDELLGLFNAINDNGQTIVMVTHSVKAASTAKRVLFIKDGEVFHQLYRFVVHVEVNVKSAVKVYRVGIDVRACRYPHVGICPPDYAAVIKLVGAEVAYRAAVHEKYRQHGGDDYSKH